MAEEVAFIIKIEGQDRAINSLKDLKKAKKDATDAFLKGDKDAAKALADLTDKTEDLADASRSLKGSGVEQSANSFRLLGDGFKNLDLDKIKTGFSGLGSAMKAIPLLLIVEGITYLVMNFDELSKGSGILATALQAVSKVVSWLVDGLTDLIGTTSDATRAIEKQGEALTKNAEEYAAALNSTTAAYDRQITAAKASGKSTVEIEKAKQQAIIDTNLAVAKQIESFVRAGGVLDEEKRKLLNGSLESIKNAKVQEYVIEETDHKAKKDQYIKNKELLAKAKEDQLKKEESALKETEKLKEDYAKQKENEQKQKELDKQKEEIALAETRLKNLKEIQQQEIKLEQDKAAELALIDQLTAEQKIAVQTASLSAASQLVGLASQLSAKNKNIQKAALIAESAIGVGKIVINTNSANAAVLAKYALIPGGQALAVPEIALNKISAGLGIASTIAATAKALSALGGGGGGAAGGTPSLGGGFSGGGSSSVPNVTPPTPQQSTLLDSNGQPINNNQQQIIKVINVESDTTRVQQAVQRVRNQATI